MERKDAQRAVLVIKALGISGRLYSNTITSLIKSEVLRYARRGQEDAFSCVFYAGTII